MPATFLGVRHHSPACARLVASTIETLRPAIVLVEGPADVNDRIDELLLGHRLPIAIFSYYRDAERAQSSWTPFCEYSPEWVALTAGRAQGAEVRFIDLPAWHPALSERRNRYADAEIRYSAVVDELCRRFAVDNVDTLWDHLFETGDDVGLAERLAAYFDLLRGVPAGEEPAVEETDGDPARGILAAARPETAGGSTPEDAAGVEVSPADAAREAYMADRVRAAVAEAGDRPVLVITGGFHRPALVAAAGTPEARTAPPEVPRPAEDAVTGSCLVPYSFARLDSFVGYEAGMPSPEYYRRLWEHGPERAAEAVMTAVVGRLRERGQPVSTADLIAARAAAEGLARLRGHRVPSRTDMLDGLVTALVSEDLEHPLPWTSRGRITPGTHPAVVEMVSALRGDHVGELHPDTPAPPLVHTVQAELERHGLVDGEVTLDLTGHEGRERSRLLHRLRVLGIPDIERTAGPTTGTEAVAEENWRLADGPHRLTALIEAGAYGATPVDAVTALLEERTAAARSDVDALAAVLFDAASCGLAESTRNVAVAVEAGVAGAMDLGALGRVLATVLGLWRHDRLLGSARSPLFGALVRGSVTRVLWLSEAIQAGPGPADLPRLAAVAATRDALRHAETALGLDRAAAVAVMRRISVDEAAPPDLRGAAFGFCWSLGDGDSGIGADAGTEARAAALPRVLGDWLTGLFLLARDEVLTAGARSADVDANRADVLTVLDEIVAAMTDEDFLLALPALRGAFEFFPPREREAIAEGLLARRGLAGSARGLLRTAVDPLLIAEATALEARVARLCAREGLVPTEDRR
ncbi:hypothetical protein FHR81_002164 [Actinoalloteichus hoggarensis]|uniref:Uncharacterized protein n=1 Tax=Actinoalloteichus hoggarensis TaxID=1470176 RepID=A0A221W6C2_9PSEU|nr:DUF5682 family protein [Actinoalloteichus hoggarensis]ASO21196.1 hypothetical protein AHOG_17855 [Actinoalloteichus hoggarensis]MBB5921126.1 hypothetical protein [Actinoalloteichus hoggarensis]